MLRVNFLGAGSLLLECLRQLRRRGGGALVLLSSVAAERPRGSNPIYGAAKVGIDALAQGLSDAIASSGVRVLVVRPGFVKTRMTAGLTPAPFATTPEAVASATVAALRGHAGTIWVLRSLRFGIRPAAASSPRHLPKAPAVRAKLLLVDVWIAIVVALIVLAITPGLAVAAAIAVVTLGACAVSFRRDARRRRPRRRTRAPRRGNRASRV